MSFGISRKFLTWTFKAATRSSIEASLVGSRLGLIRELHGSATTTTKIGLYSSANVSSTKFQHRRHYSDDKVDHEVGASHITSKFDKRILVWTKYYPSLSEVPDTVSHAKMKRAKDVFRIRVNIWMGVWTVVGCIITIYWGRRSAKRGESLTKQNLEWHESINKEK